MQSATERYRTYRARIRDWSNYRLTLESLGQDWDGDEEEGESEWRLWLEIDEPGAPLVGAPPSRFRVEHRRHGRMVRGLARDGDRYWCWPHGDAWGRPESEVDVFLHFPSPVIPWWESDRDPDISDDEWLARPPRARRAAPRRGARPRLAGRRRGVAGGRVRRRARPVALRRVGLGGGLMRRACSGRVFVSETTTWPDVTAVTSCARPACGFAYSAAPMTTARSRHVSVSETKTRPQETRPAGHARGGPVRGLTPAMARRDG
jgi:hypothetical protein